MATRLRKSGQKRTLLVLFVPSVERDGRTSIDQDYWVHEALGLFGRVFGGATAYPRARGVWRDDEKNNQLVFDEPVVIQCYAKLDDVEDDARLAELSAFCRRLGREAHQGEVGIVIENEYCAIRDFEPET